ncbi:TonB-dependent receptor [Lunatimonas sp.]|uniref:SusC/RagA family TonB-linked outer membrane protein n=1 Tax=Lunatimonas sp. TaxID=2060141 RepID=UPI00263A959C|nr:TonB-dependent receptor [Lunatimonas sp.]
MLSRFFLSGFLLQLFILNVVLAVNVNAQFERIDEVKVTLSQTDLSLRQFFRAVESKSGFKFSYDNRQIDLSVQVRITATEGTIEEMLKEVASQASLGFRQVNDQIDVRKVNTPVVEQVTLEDVTIRGIVRDENGDPLPGATISVQGSTIGTVTDLDGSYSITVPDNAVLVFSYIGYESTRIEIGNRTEIDVTMRMDASSLEEVVVIGYGTTKRSDLTGAVSSVKSEQLTAYPAIDAVQALQGRAAGVQIQATNGAPGAAMKVRVRGGTSINASSDPIFVVDGFIGAAMPPPEDIQSVEVLKDASATAIYGSRGANGVIMITTKRGSKGKPRIEFNSSYSMQNEINRLDLLDADQFIDYIQEARPNIQSAGGNTDWQDQIFRTGGIQNYQLSVSGGNDGVNYYVSGAYFDQKGVIINSNFNRFSITSNLDIQATEKLKIGLNIFAQRSESDGVRTQEGSGGLTPGVVASAFKFEPDQPIRRPDGTFTVARLNDPHDNPYAVATSLVNQNVNDRFQGNFFAEYDIAENLKFRTTFGATTNSGRNGLHSPTTVTEGRNVGGDASINASRSTLLLNENYLTYTKTLGETHNLSFMGGYSYQSSENESWGARGQNFITDAFSYWNLGSAAVWQTPNSNLSDWRISSFYGRANYSISDKYLFTFNARYDGSSTFSRNNKWAFFPSGAVAWNMKNERFLETSDLVSFWKWRGSYGITGNQAISPFQTLARFSPVFTILNNVPVNAVRPTTVANNNLTWETTAQLNIGTDIGLWDDRVTLSAEYYRMVTSDLLFSVPLPRYSGYTTQLQNIGKVENKGLEMTLTTRNLVGPFQWNMDLNVSRNVNKVLTLPEGTDIRYGSGPGHMVGLGDTQVLREGYPVGSFYGWIYEGVYQQGDDFIPGGGFEQVLGGEKFRDINGDGVLNASDRDIIGNPHPDFIWGWNNDFRWKNFDLNIFFQGSYGNDILSYTLMELDLLSGINNATTAALNRWTPTNTNTDVPRAALGRTRRVSTRWIYDGTFTRLKNLSLGYNFPQSITSRLKVSKLRVYASAQNILTFTSYRGYDPEVNYQSGGATNGNRNLGLDYGSYPNAKNYTFGLNVGF